MTALGDDGSKTERDFDIGVRSPNAYVTTRDVRSLDPRPHRSRRGDALGADMLPGTATLDLVGLDDAGLRPAGPAGGSCAATLTAAPNRR